jgi:hypothetical protein
MPRHWLGPPGGRLVVNVMFPTMPEQATARSFQGSNQITPFHATSNSSTLRIPGMGSVEKST